MHTQKRILFNKDMLKAFRKEKGFTQSELADFLDTSLNVISYWETGKRTPLPHTVDRLVEATHLPHQDWYLVNEKTLGTKITTIRLQKNISQREMANDLGTSVENLNRWEADRHVPSAYFLYRISHRLGYTMEDLITNERGDLLITDPHKTEGEEN